MPISPRCHSRAAEFDAIICNHVLEHVPDDRAAMLELRRILRPGGTAILMVPFHPDRETFEDPSVVDPEQRTELFGHSTMCASMAEITWTGCERRGSTSTATSIGSRSGKRWRFVTGCSATSI